MKHALFDSSNLLPVITYTLAFTALCIGVSYLFGCTNGRMRRSTYWIRALITALLGFFCSCFAVALALAAKSLALLTILPPLVHLIAGSILFFFQVRRFHDAGYSGSVALGLVVAGIPLACMGFLAGHGSWMPILLFLAPVTIPSLIILCKDSEKGMNKWGMSEKYPTEPVSDNSNSLPDSNLNKAHSANEEQSQKESN